MNMMKRFGFHALLGLAGIGGLASCKQKDDPVAFNSLKFEFNNIVGDRALELVDVNNPGNKWYKNPQGDSFQVTVYKYYISNVVLHGANGSTYTEPESYHLINQEDAASRKFTLTNVPVGDYTSVTFMIGVDSARNVSGAQTGDLSVDKGMFWTWNTGYIMAKMEGFGGTSTNTDHSFVWHTGGFSGQESVLKTVTLPFPSKATVSGSNIPNVHIFSDVQEWFKNPATIDFANFTNVMSGKKVVDIANNYADMFTVDHIDN